MVRRDALVDVDEERLAVDVERAASDVLAEGGVTA